MSVRQEANRAIITLLAAMVEEFPDGRFGQILVNMDIIRTHNNMETITHSQEKLRRWADDPFFDESTFTLARMLSRSDT